jgi:hypothetical protein
VETKGKKHMQLGQIARMAFGFLLLSCSNASIAANTLSIGNAPAYPGTTVSVPAFVSSSNAVAAQFDVAVSPARAGLGEALIGRAGSDHRVRSIEVAAGVRRVLVYSMNNRSISNRGAIVNLPVTVLPQEHVGSGPIAPSNVILATKEATAIAPVELIAGQVLTRPVNPNGDGTVQFFLPSTNDGRYLIQASTNFVDWLTITNVQANADFMDLIDADASRFPYRFYRPILYEAAGEITGVTRNGNGLTFQVNALNGRAYLLQASTDLVHWTDVGTGAVSSGTLSFDAAIEPGVSWKFYRLKSGGKEG